jgi:hypothetical protein
LSESPHPAVVVLAIPTRPWCTTTRPDIHSTNVNLSPSLQSPNLLVLALSTTLQLHLLGQNSSAGPDCPHRRRFRLVSPTAPLTLPFKTSPPRTLPSSSLQTSPLWPAFSADTLSISRPFSKPPKAQLANNEGNPKSAIVFIEAIRAAAPPGFCTEVNSQPPQLSR